MVVEPTSPQPPVIKIREPLISILFLCSGLLTDWPRRVPDDNDARCDVVNHITSNSEHGASANRRAIDDRATAADITIIRERDAARNRYIGADEAIIPDLRIMMKHGIWQDTDVIANAAITGYDHARHDEGIEPNFGKRGNSRHRMDYARKSFIRQPQIGNRLASRAKRRWTARRGENMCVWEFFERAAIKDREATRLFSLLWTVVDKSDETIGVAKAVERLEAIAIERKNEQRRAAIGSLGHAPLRKI
ncbi:MAG: hypothetical protein U1E20_15705 [Methylocystis sp.]